MSKINMSNVDLSKVTGKAKELVRSDSVRKGARGIGLAIECVIMVLGVIMLLYILVFMFCMPDMDESTEDVSVTGVHGLVEDMEEDDKRLDGILDLTSGTEVEGSFPATSIDSNNGVAATPFANNYVSNSGGANTESAAEKTWIEETEQVWVVDQKAWTEQVPVYTTSERSICNTCSADITGSTAAHGKVHMLAGENSGHHSEITQYVSHYETVEHTEAGHWETVVVSGHWE